MKLVSLIAGLLAALLIVLSASASAAEKSRPQYVIGEQHRLQSEILGEMRTFWVSLPESYASSSAYREYPVLYALDGNLFFHSFTGVVRQLSSDATPLIPEMIVVGIDSTNRLRDSTPTQSLVGPNGRASDDWAASGGGEAFQRFIEDELIPYVDAHFAASEYRVLAGYSLTGLPVAYNLLTRPHVFDAHIVMDGSIWWDEAMIMGLAREALGAHRFKKNQLFVTTTAHRYPAPYITVDAGGRELAALLKDKDSELRVVHHEHSRETHHNLAAASIYEGLISIFDGHMMTLDELYLKPDAIPARFERLSERLGAVFHPPEGVIDFFGYNFMRYLPDQEIDKALIYFEMNVANYPRSPNAWASLGAAYLETCDDKRAADAFSRALELQPGYLLAENGLRASQNAEQWRDPSLLCLP